MNPMAVVLSQETGGWFRPVHLPTRACPVRHARLQRCPPRVRPGAVALPQGPASSGDLGRHRLATRCARLRPEPTVCRAVSDPAPRTAVSEPALRMAAFEPRCSRRRLNPHCAWRSDPALCTAMSEPATVNRRQRSWITRAPWHRFVETLSKLRSPQV